MLKSLDKFKSPYSWAGPLKGGPAHNGIEGPRSEGGGIV